jgi:hypothetical protein
MEYVSRCPACSSLVRSGQDWCTLCHADLRPPQVEVAQLEVQELRTSAPAETTPAVEHDWIEHEGAEQLLEPTTLLLADRALTSAPVLERPALGKHARHAAPEEPASPGQFGAPVGTRPPESEIAQLLAQLAAESRDPLGGVLGRLPESQGMRVILALAAGSALAVVLVAVAWILGLIFG